MWLDWNNPRNWSVYTPWHHFWQGYENNQNKWTWLSGCEAFHLLEPGMPSQGQRQRLLAEKELQGKIRSLPLHPPLLSPALDLIWVQRCRVCWSWGLGDGCAPYSEVPSGFFAYSDCIPTGSQTSANLPSSLPPSNTTEYMEAFGKLRRDHPLPFLRLPQLLALHLRPRSLPSISHLSFRSLPVPILPCPGGLLG